MFSRCGSKYKGFFCEYPKDEKTCTFAELNCLLYNDFVICPKNTGSIKTSCYKEIYYYNATIQFVNFFSGNILETGCNSIAYFEFKSINLLLIF